MPTYDYTCGACGGFDALRSMSERDEPAACPDCGVPSPRVWASAPRLALLDAGTRSALATNERARHEPRSSRDADHQRLKHPAGCGCCSTGSRRNTIRGADGSKSFAGQRPWMISH